MSTYAGIDVGILNLGLTFYVDGNKVESHKLDPFAVRTTKGFKRYKFTEKLAIDYAIWLADQYKSRFKSANGIGIEQQFKKQRLVVLCTALLSVFRAKFPSTPVFKVRAQDWRGHFGICPKGVSYSARKSMSADYVRSMVTQDVWDAIVEKYRLTGACDKNVDALESALIAIYVSEKVDVLVGREAKPPPIKRKCRGPVIPDASLVFRIDRSKARTPAPRRKSEKGSKKKKELKAKAAKPAVRQKKKKEKVAQVPPVIDLT